MTKNTAICDPRTFNALSGGPSVFRCFRRLPCHGQTAKDDGMHHWCLRQNRAVLTKDTFSQLQSPIVCARPSGFFVAQPFLPVWFSGSKLVKPHRQECLYY